MINVDSAWRQLIEGKNHIALANFLIQSYENFTAIALKINLIDQDGINKNYLASLNLEDLSDVCRLYLKFRFKIFDDYRSKFIFLNVNELAYRALQKSYQLSSNEKTELEKTVELIKSIYPAMSILQNMRNTHAHVKKEITDKNYVTQVAGAVLYISSLKKTEPLDRIHSQAEILLSSLYNDNYIPPSIEEDCEVDIKTSDLNDPISIVEPERKSLEDIETEEDSSEDDLQIEKVSIADAMKSLNLIRSDITKFLKSRDIRFNVDEIILKKQVRDLVKKDRISTINSLINHSLFKALAANEELTNKQVEIFGEDIDLILRSIDFDL